MSTTRGRALTVLAMLFAVLALTNFAKFVPVTDDTGFVLFGARLSGPANTVAGITAGSILLTYAIGIWRLRRWALPVGCAYAAYVVANSVLFRLRYPLPTTPGQRLFEVTYSVIAIGTSVGTAWLLARRRSQLS